MFTKIVSLATIFVVCYGVEFQIQNKEIGDVWIGIQGNPGHPHLNEGGFVLRPGQKISIQAPANWAGRFWARSWCNPSNNHCDTGDCGNKLKCNGAGGAPPVTLVEITLKGYGGLDYYDISLVDGFNLRASIQPLGGQGDGGPYSCKKTSCPVVLNDQCPEELKVTISQAVVGCKSACIAFNTDQYCCRGAHNRPDTCKSSTWPTNYPEFFKSRCPDAYSYAYDDQNSTFTCKAEVYLIIFGA